MSTPKAPTAHKSAYVIEKGLKQSLESTDVGLKQFLQSLEKSGMIEALQGYRALQTVLVQQRLWARTHGRTQVDPAFRSIAKTAAELHRIFSAYADAMKPLKELDRIKGAAAVAASAPAAPKPEGEGEGEGG